MPNYDKSQDPFVYGYGATRSDQQQSYDALAQTPAGSQYAVTQAQVPHGSLDTVQMPFIPVQQFEVARDVSGYQTSDFPLIDRRSHQMPEVTLYKPSVYTPGTKIYVNVRSQYDLIASPAPLYFAMIVGNRPIDATISPLGHRDHYYHFSVIADAPSFQSTTWSSPEVPLCLQMLEPTGRNSTIKFGTLSYGIQDNYQTYDTSSFVRKRKVSPDVGEYSRSPAKRSSTQQLRARAGEGSGAHESTPSSASSSSPFMKPGVPTTYGYAGNTIRHQQQQQQQIQLRPSRSFHNQYPSIDASPGAAEMQSPLMSSPHESYSSNTLSAPRSTSISTTSVSTRRPEPSSSANPQLIRTSTITQSPPSTVQRSGSTQAFNPYAMYPANSKAVLKIEGDLDKMSENWTDEEWEANRRIVQFTRTQNGSIIHTTFRPVTLEERAANSICISCIWWEEKSECYVTSVDTIHLLESLVGVRFTVEEKNRIRRNLEGFRPATVSKAKQDSEEFFKIIMGFPNPKPRNIEKDVKVFPWRILAHALKKIIGKYSASYSSTAGALPPVTSRGYGSSSGSSGLSTDALSVSPSGRSASHGYVTGMTTSTSMMSTVGASAGSSEVHLHPAMPADFRAGLGASQLDTTPAQDHNAYQLQLQQQAIQQQQQQQQQHSQSRQPSAAYSSLLGSTERSSWDLVPSYIDPSPVTATPGGAAQALQQQYGGSVTSPTESTGSAGAQGPSPTYHGLPGYEHSRGA